MNFFSALKRLTDKFVENLMKRASADANKELYDRKTTPGRPQILSPFDEPVQFDGDTEPINTL